MGRRKKEETEIINEQPTGWVDGAMPEPISSLPAAPDPKPTPKAKVEKPKVERQKTFGIYYERSEYKGHSFLEALRLAGIDPSFISRKKIAEANGITNYLGLGKDNKELLDLFVAGELKRPNS